MANELVITGSQSLIPVQVAAAGEQAAIRFIEFFTANIRNPDTRAAYARAVSDFFRWCEGREDIALIVIQTTLRANASRTAAQAA